MVAGRGVKIFPQRVVNQVVHPHALYSEILDNHGVLRYRNNHCSLIQPIKDNIPLFVLVFGFCQLLSHTRLINVFALINIITNHLVNGVFGEITTQGDNIKLNLFACAVLIILQVFKQSAKPVIAEAVIAAADGSRVGACMSGRDDDAVLYRWDDLDEAGEL